MADKRTPPRSTLGATHKPGSTQASEADYKIEVTSWGSWGQFYARVRIQRRTDRKQIFPCDGSETPGPYASAEAAREAGQLLAQKIVAADIANPE